jgi:hypothetical protein
LDEVLGDAGLGQPDSGTQTCDIEVTPSDLEVQQEWAFEGQDGELSAVSMPAVADLTGDGTPDVVATLYPPGGWDGLGHLYVLDGATGRLHFRIEDPVGATAHPAIGDIDADGEPEIVSIGRGTGDEELGLCQGRLLAWSADGTLEWEGETVFGGCQYAVGLADFEGDGDVEIYAGGLLADHEGREIFNVEQGIFGIQASVAADLDEDGELELIIGSLALRLDGSVYYDVQNEIPYGHPQVADLDGDRRAEVLLATPAGPRLIQHDGTLDPIVDESEQDPQNPSSRCNWGWMPAAIGDFDDDGYAEIVGPGHSSICLANADLEPLWDHCTQDDGYAAITAFDLFGDGGAEVLYTDNRWFYIFSEHGEILFRTESLSVTQMDFPLVVDADADGQAEVLVISNDGYEQQQQPAVRSFGSAGVAWAGTRTIWNQYTFHETNVEDDATIPSPEPLHWREQNSFRIQHVR